ncbi:MAG TPA: hypothetical protein VFE61_18935 [Candidatus Sulfotelmatobacter sp.]|jgi:hypothetical protein|nr:hypothetical protein [Candidatus Sulfotelmatobacter sp.]
MSNAQAGDLRAPADAIAGNPASIATTGSGAATFYLVGPTVSLKRDVQLGQEVSIAAQYLQSSGRYIGIVCADSCQSVEFFVRPAKPVSLTFLVHPSRAPVGQSDAISGVALPFDEFKNLVFAPATVGFQLVASGTTLMTRPVSTQGGIAWFRTTSGKSAGPLQVVAAIDDVSARRVVQQVAADPCSLHLKGQRNSKGFVVETDPVRDCAGNPVPDGTVVTFTAKAGTETSTVDAPIKQGIARAQMTAGGAVSVSAASGVVMGNELRLGAQ